MSVESASSARVTLVLQMQSREGGGQTCAHGTGAERKTPPAAALLGVHQIMSQVAALLYLQLTHNGATTLTLTRSVYCLHGQAEVAVRPEMRGAGRHELSE